MVGSFLSVHVTEFSRYGICICVASFILAVRVPLLVPDLSGTLLAAGAPIHKDYQCHLL